MVSSDASGAVAPYLQEALDSGAYPLLKRMVHDVSDVDPDDRFERGHACVMIGLATTDLGEARRTS